jgi:hypothetical protein
MSAAKPGDLLRVVLDTNVYFSAFHSVPGVLFELWRRAVPAIVQELASVLRVNLKWPEADIIAQLKLVVRVASVVEPKIRLHVIPADSGRRPDS